jgi:hemerythrin superfamily protein
MWRFGRSCPLTERSPLEDRSPSTTRVEALKGTILAAPMQTHRKEITMNQGSTSSSPDVIGFLKGQHEQIKGLFEQVLAAKGPAREKSFTALKALMTAHEAAEEKVVHPAAKQAIAGGPAEVAARLKEENEAKKALSALDKLDVGSKDFESHFVKLQKAVLAHARSEETEEFDKLADELGPNALKAMRVQAEDVEKASARANTR